MKTFWRDLLGEEAADQLVAETHQMIEELGTEGVRRMIEQDEGILPRENIAA